MLVRVLAPRELKIRYRRSSLMAVWAIATPVILLAVYGTVLTKTFGVDGDGVPYLTSAWIGLVVWTFFAAAIAGAVTSILNSADLFARMSFPAEAIPLAVVVASLLDLAVGSVALVVLGAVQGVRPGWWALASVLPVLMVLVWTSALAVLVAVLAAFIRDVVHGVHLVLRVGFFATPIVYDAVFLPDSLLFLATLNPLAVAITSLRETLLRNSPPDWWLVGLQTVAGTILLVGALWYVRRVGRRLVDVV